MPVFDATQLQINTELLTEDHHRLIAIYEGQAVSNAIYRLSGDIMVLTWIETNEGFQCRGLASRLLDELLKKAIATQCQLSITNIVEEKLLDGFYFHWFRKTVDPENDFHDEISIKFDSMCRSNEINTTDLLISHADLEWRPNDAARTHIAP